MIICNTQQDAMVEDYAPNPVTYPPMTWAQALEWLLANGYTTLIFPTEMTGDCVIPQRVRSTLRLFNYHLEQGKDDGTYVIETGVNAHGHEVAWVYEEGIPMEEWHEYQRGCVYYLEPGGEEPDEYLWSHWPHCALGLRDRNEEVLR